MPLILRHRTGKRRHAPNLSQRFPIRSSLLTEIPAMDHILPPPHLFDRRFDRASHDHTLWRALLDGYSPAEKDTPMQLWNVVGRSSPVELAGYGYPQAEHWLREPSDPDSAIALFDFPARLNIWQPGSTFACPYFSLPSGDLPWTTEDVEDARMLVSCELLPQDAFAPYPPSAQVRSRRMLDLLRVTQDAQENRMPAGDVTSFWRGMDNGQSYFLLESHPLFQPPVRSRGKYQQHSFDGYLFNPPAVYDEYMNLVLPQHYPVIFTNGDVVVIRSALCMVRDGVRRHYKHRLLQMHKMPVSLE
ncbi:hypothetical protein NMY22_g18192 [Coprinellus aureogranulatus]|nr:hypothetical protein NMY22_g18192 [Coprinellus aureogranulatus]